MRQRVSSRLACSSVVVVLAGAFAAACGGIVGPLDEGGSIGDTIGNAVDDGGSHSGGGRGNGGNGNGGGMGGGSGGSYGDDDDDDSGSGDYGDDDDDDDGGYVGDDDESDGGVVLVDAAPPSPDSGGHVGDASAADSGIQDAGVGDVSGSALLGSIVVSPYPVQGKGRPPGNIQASFYTEIPAAPATCTVTTVGAGACVLHRCPAGGTVPLPTHVSSTAEAGTITANVSGTMDTLTYSTASSSYSIGTFFDPGYDGKISVSAAGFAGSVPAFSLSIPEPAAVAITSPVETLVTKSPPSGAPAVYATSFARLSNLPVAWTGGVPGTEVVLTLTAVATNVMAGYDSLTCTFDQGDGADIIPSAGGLALLPPVDGKAYIGTLGLQYKSSATVAAGPATITLSETATNRTIVTFTTTN